MSTGAKLVLPRGVRGNRGGPESREGRDASARARKSLGGALAGVRQAMRYEIKSDDALVATTRVVRNSCNSARRVR